MAQRKGNGRGWVFRWREIDAATGRMVRHCSEEYAKKITCEVDEAKKRRELADAKLAARARRGALPLATVLERWAKAPSKRGQNKSDRYQRESVRDLSAIAAARKWTVCSDITADEVDAWHATTTGVNRSLSILLSVLKYARRTLKQVVDGAVFDMTPRPSTDTLPPELLDSDDVARAIADADAYDADPDHGIRDGRMGTLVRHHALYGPRSTTLAKLTVGDYNEVAKVLTLRRLKNGRTLQHQVHADMAVRLSRLCAGRAPTEPLYRSPSHGSWFGAAKSGQHGISTWFRRHCLDHLPPDRRGIYLLKDWAITQMDLADIDDRTKATFTGHTSLRTFALYKGTNARMAAGALAKIPSLPSLATGAKMGASETGASKMGATSPQPRTANRSETTSSDDQPGRTATTH